MSLPDPHDLDGAHLWIFALPDDGTESADDLALLTPDERARAQAYVVPGPRTRFVAARARLRRTLSGYLAQAPADIRFAVGPFGKPTIPGSGVRFNLSHTEGMLLIAVTRGVDVGVDVERIRSVTHVSRLSARLFTDRERSQVEGDDDLAFLRLWTCREAALKAAGSGISAGWNQVEVDLDPPARAVGLDRACHLQPLIPARGWVGALATMERRPSILTVHADAFYPGSTTADGSSETFPIDSHPSPSRRTS